MRALHTIHPDYDVSILYRDVSGGTDHAYYTELLVIQVVSPNKVSDDLYGESSKHCGFVRLRARE